MSLVSAPVSILFRVEPLEERRTYQPAVTCQVDSVPFCIIYPPQDDRIPCVFRPSQCHGPSGCSVWAELGDKYTPSQKNIDVDDFFGGRGVLEEIPQLFQDTTLCDVVNSSGLCGSEHAMRRGTIDAHASWEEHERTLKCNPQPQIPILEA